MSGRGERLNMLIIKLISISYFKVIDKKITTTDTGIHFKKLKTLKLTYENYNTFLEDLAKTRKVELSEIKNKLANCGLPGFVSAAVNLRMKFLVSYKII